MRGLVLHGGDPLHALADWEATVVDAVGNVVEFWGFKANDGRVWALLYLRGEPFTAAQIGRALGLSKGAVSMVTREMEQWGVLHRMRQGAGPWAFVAEMDFLAMIGRVLEARESVFVARVKSDLERAEQAARGKASRAQLERIHRMRKLADFVERAVGVFLKTARFDVAGALGILAGRERTGGSPWRPPPSPATPRAASAASTKGPRGSSGTAPRR
jgi:DNA-binding transcriptional regulator GbsR (MarR family)